MCLRTCCPLLEGLAGGAQGHREWCHFRKREEDGREGEEKGERFTFLGLLAAASMISEVNRTPVMAFT